MEHAVYLATGRLARPADQYPLMVANAILFHSEDAQDALKAAAQRNDPDAPKRTGDELADEWERQIARGELPDWLKGGPDG